jgi:hypothetical protein
MKQPGTPTNASKEPGIRRGVGRRLQEANRQAAEVARRTGLEKLEVEQRLAAEKMEAAERLEAARRRRMARTAAQEINAHLEVRKPYWWPLAGGQAVVRNRG